MNSNFDPDFATPSDWATLYRAQGIQVVPGFMPFEVKSGQSWKRPLLKSWAEFQEALIPDEVFLQWYGPGGLYASRRNMGVICGRASHNIFIIDLDVHKNQAAAQWWAGLLVVHNNNMELETVTQRTGGGGLQLLFEAPMQWQAPTNKTSIGVDIRGQGGFAVLCPSMHESGKAYEWLEGRSPAEIQILMAPDWLLEAVEEVVRRWGGVTSPSSGNGPIAPPQSQEDGFGALVDGRETFMRDMVWAAVVNWHRECPLPINDALSLGRAQEEYAVYFRNVEPQTGHLNTANKADQLEAEGRGWTEWWAKWKRACRQWDGKIHEEARKPGPHPRIDRGPCTESGSLIITSEQLVARFTPPAYLIDGILQRGYLYSLTARTGHGKTAVAMYVAQCIARGVPMHGCPVKQGTVLILAGENPDDVTARFMVLAEFYGFDIKTIKMRWIPGVKHLPSHMAQIRIEAEAIDDLMLVIVDTAAAYFPGTETNSNSEQGSYARLLRELTFLRGKPAVIVNCHPVKNAQRDNLIPMGGSAFLNEVDGNLTLWANAEKQTSLHWLGKFRGPEFNPMSFEIVVSTSTLVKDAEGRLMPNAVAQPITDAVMEQAVQVQQSDEDRLLQFMHGSPKASFSELASRMALQKWQVQRVMDRLKEDKMVVKHRGGKYRLTDKGKTEIGVKNGGRNDTDFG